jgi:hypothetical protein
MRLSRLAVVFVLAPFVARAEQRAERAYRNYIPIVRVGFRRLVALGVIASMTLTGCASGYYYAVPDLRDRANQIASIAVVPVDVRVYRDGFGGRQFSGEWSETARTNLRNTLAKQFGSDPRFAVREFDPKAAEAAQSELEQVRHAMEGIRPASMEKGGACLPGPAPALADTAGTDTLLLLYAGDNITTAGKRTVILIGLVVVAPIALAVMVLLFPFGSSGSVPRLSNGGASDLPLGGFPVRAAITLCLVDARKGDTLWFDLEPIGTGNLLDASDVERLIGGAYAKFKKAVQQ